MTALHLFTVVPFVLLLLLLLLFVFVAVVVLVLRANDYEATDQDGPALSDVVRTGRLLVAARQRTDLSAAERLSSAHSSRE